MVNPMRRSARSDDIEAIPLASARPSRPAAAAVVRRHRRRPRSFDVLIKPSY